MTMTEPQIEALQDDDGFLPTPAQQALAEQRLAEMIANPSMCMTGDEFIAWLESDNW